MMEEEVPSASPRGAASRRTGASVGLGLGLGLPQEDNIGNDNDNRNGNGNDNDNDHDRTPRRSRSMIGIGLYNNYLSRYLSPSYLMSRVLFVISLSMKILALLLYPLRFLSTVIFPPGEFDDISSKDASKRAAVTFVAMMNQTYIKPRRNNNNSGNGNGHGHGNNMSSGGAGGGVDNDFMMCPFVEEGYSELVQDIAFKAHTHQNIDDASANASTAGNDDDGADNDNVAPPPPLLLLYLHSPLHGQVPSFVSNTLCNDNFLSMLNQHVHNGTLACWGGSIHSADGAHVQNSLQVNSYPFLALVKVQPKAKGGNGGNGNGGSNNNSAGRRSNTSNDENASSSTSTRTSTSTTTNNDINNNNNNGNNSSTTTTTIQKQNLELHFRMEGPSLQSISPSNLHLHLSNSLNAYQQQLSEQTLRRLQRQEEIHLRQEQDREYREALEEDRRREREKQEEAERIEAEERRAREEVEQAESRKREKLQKARDLLGVEEEDDELQPDNSNGDGNGNGNINGSANNMAAGSVSRSRSRSIARIRLMLPSGKRVERKFWGDDSVNVVRAFLMLHFDENDIEMDNFQLSSNYPKKALVNGDATLEEEGLCPQSVIMVQDLDA